MVTLFRDDGTKSKTLTAEGMFDKEKSSKEKKKNTRARAHFIYALVCERRFGPGHTKTTHAQQKVTQYPCSVLVG